QRLNGAEQPVLSPRHENDAFRIGDDDFVVAAMPGALYGVDVQLEDNDAADTAFGPDRCAEIVATLERGGAERKETPLSALYRVGEIGAVAEILFDKRRILIVVGRRQRDAVRQ